MNEVLTQNDIDHALESTAGVVIDVDTVAIYFKNEGVCGMYGVYVKHPANPVWELQMTTLRLESIMQ